MRRYQNSDGSLTPKGRQRYNKVKVKSGYNSPYDTTLNDPKRYYIVKPIRRLKFKGIKTKKYKEYQNEYRDRYDYFSKKRDSERKRTNEDVKDILRSMSKNDLDLLNIHNERGVNNYVNSGYGFIKRFVAKDENNIPVAFLDLKEDYGNLNVVIGTRAGEQYRNKGYATAVTKAGMAWVDKNAQYLEEPYKYIQWNAYSQNTGSRRLAEKNNFKKIDENFNNYEDWDDVEYFREIKSRNR